MHEVLIGFDPNGRRAWNVCANSILQNAYIPPPIRPIGIQTLGDGYKRLTENRNGRLFDVISNAPMSTEFALARFFTPIVGRARWVLFCDGDFMFRADINELFALADSRYAVQVVKHEYHPTESEKMDGQLQTDYAKKNWSSLMLWNMKHAGHKRIWLDDANTKPGLWLHQFAWLKDGEIGELPLEWNWLDGTAPIFNPQAVHFTRGTPDMPGFENTLYAYEWHRYDTRKPDKEKAWLKSA